jgi:hypothetical protein
MFIEKNLNKVTTKSQKFRSIGTLLDRMSDGDHDLCSQVIERLNDLYHEIINANKFSVFSMILYQIYQSRFDLISGKTSKKRVPSFFENDFLENQFLLDPSNYSIVLGIAIKKLQIGDQIRARQLFQRVANSRYREHTLAKNYLSRFFKEKSDKF